MNGNYLFTTPVVTSQSCEQCPAALPLAPRPSTKLLPSEALLLGPSFPNLSTPPYFPHDLLMSESEGDQGGDGRSNFYHARGRSCIGKNHEHRCRTLAPLAIIRLRPRCSGYTLATLMPHRQFPSALHHRRAVGRRIIQKATIETQLL